MSHGPTVICHIEHVTCHSGTVHLCHIRVIFRSCYFEAVSSGCRCKLMAGTSAVWGKRTNSSKQTAVFSIEPAHNPFEIQDGPIRRLVGMLIPSAKNVRHIC